MGKKPSILPTNKQKSNSTKFTGKFSRNRYTRLHRKGDLEGGSSGSICTVLLGDFFFFPQFIYLLFLNFLAAPQSMLDLSSPIRNQICAPCSVKSKVSTTGPPEMPSSVVLAKPFLKGSGPRAVLTGW